jgi:hypothetical protein
MKAHIIKHNIKGMTHQEACPYCGFFTNDVSKYPTHMQEKHPLVGYEWKLAEVQPMSASAWGDKYWIVQSEFKHGK